MRKFIRSLRQIISAQRFTPQHASGQHDLFQRHAQMYHAAIQNVWFFYIAGLFLTSRFAANGWPVWIERDTISPLWPLVWVQGIDVPLVTTAIVLLVVASSIPVIVQPHRQLFRCFCFVGFFFTVTYVNSFGKINHGFHAWLFVAFIYCFLPNWSTTKNGKSPPSITHRQQLLTILFAAQAMVMLFYSMSGAWKIYTAINQIQAGQIHAFHPYALAYLTADRLLQTSTPTMLGAQIIEYPILGWPLHISAIYIELFAVVAAFRPTLHRLWGILLVLFHFGTILILSIGFTQNMLLIGLLLIMSPFTPPDTSWRDILTRLPLFGVLYQIWQKRRRYKTQENSHLRSN